MSERIKDRVLVLRLPEKLQEKVRLKMKEISSPASVAAGNASNSTTPTASDVIADIPGVNLVPTNDNSTMWWMYIDGKRYPARLTNLPNPVELHKTVDHAKYYKSVDVGQMLIVYESEKEVEEVESAPGYSNDSFPSYFHSGLTPPMRQILDRRFSKREHSSKAFPKHDIIEVEQYLKKLIAKIDIKKTKKNASQEPKVIEQVEDEICDWEPWMGSKGVEFTENSAICKEHPEVWLPPAPRFTYFKDPTLKSKKSKNKVKPEKSNKPRTNLAKMESPSDNATAVAMQIINLQNGDAVENEVMDFDDFGFDFEGESFALDDF